MTITRSSGGETNKTRIRAPLVRFGGDWRPEVMSLRLQLVVMTMCMPRLRMLKVEGIPLGLVFWFFRDLGRNKG